MFGPVIIKPHEIEKMRRACRLAADTLEMVGEHIRPGITTEEINVLVHEYTLKNNARPAPLNYGGSKNRKGFPKSVCTSVNDVVCHGIPNSTEILKDGDIINVDVTSVLPSKNGYYGDTSATFYVGTPSLMTQHLVEVCRQSLEIGLRQIKPGNYIGDIGHAIQQFSEGKGCAVVREYTGHGIGRVFHGPPNVSHYGKPKTGMKIRKGMCFTVEPMLNLMGPDIFHADDWTVKTADGSWSAQFEHTIWVTAKGCEILTARHSTLKNSEDKAYSKLGKLSCFGGTL